jgi:co-chaperonin GroES (HSP10)
LAVGKDIKDIKAGDKIIYGGYSHSEVKVGPDEYLLIKNEDIYAIIK